MGNEQVLKIDLCIKNKVIKSYSFTQDVIEIGRIPTADIFIDNSGISREHTRIERSIGGPYIVKDMGSTNGTFLNDRQIKEAALNDNDIISLSKFMLKVNIKTRGAAEKPKSKPSAKDFDGTTVLSSSQIQKLHASLQDVDPDDPDREVAETKTPVDLSKKDPDFSPKQMLFWAGLLIILGIVVGLLIAR